MEFCTTRVFIPQPGGSQKHMRSNQTLTQGITSVLWAELHKVYDAPGLLIYNYHALQALCRDELLPFKIRPCQLLTDSNLDEKASKNSTLMITTRAITRRSRRTKLVSGTPEFNPLRYRYAGHKPNRQLMALVILKLSSQRSARSKTLLPSSNTTACILLD